MLDGNQAAEEEASANRRLEEGKGRNGVAKVVAPSTRLRC